MVGEASPTCTLFPWRVYSSYGQHNLLHWSMHIATSGRTVPRPHTVSFWNWHLSWAFNKPLHCSVSLCSCAHSCISFTVRYCFESIGNSVSSQMACFILATAPEPPMVRWGTACTCVLCLPQQWLGSKLGQENVRQDLGSVKYTVCAVL